jgi:hypothetical protein
MTTPAQPTARPTGEATDDSVPQTAPEPNGAASPEATSREQVAELVARLSSPEDLDASTRRRLLAKLSAAMANSARTAGGVAVLGGRWLVDLFVDIAPRIPVRNEETLRKHYDGLTGEELADQLVVTASRATALVGAAGGALAAVEWAAPPTLLSMPIQVATETLVVAAIETKLVAELHEAYGLGVPGGGTQRGLAYVQSWAERRGVDPMNPLTFTHGLSGIAKRSLRNRLLARSGRMLTTYGPFLTGAVVGASVNRGETRKLGDKVRADLRRRA